MKTAKESRSRTGYGPVRAVAGYLGLSRAQVYKLVEGGHRQALRLPGMGKAGRASVRVSWASVEALEAGSVSR